MQPTVLNLASETLVKCEFLLPSMGRCMYVIEMQPKEMESRVVGWVTCLW